MKKILPETGPLQNVVVGQRLFITNSNPRLGDTNRVATVEARTTKTITVFRDSRYDLNGHRVSRWGDCGLLRIPKPGELEAHDQHVQAEQAKSEQRQAEKDAYEARPDVKLVREILSGIQTDNGERERLFISLGVEKLQQIKDWLGI
jgi:hypothetical protein